MGLIRKQTRSVTMGGTTQLDVTIDPVNVSRTFIQLSFQCDTQPRGEFTQVCAKLENSTTVRLIRGAAGAPENVNIIIRVFEGDARWRVQHFIVSPVFTHTPVRETILPINTVQLEHAFIVTVGNFNNGEFRSVEDSSRQRFLDADNVVIELGLSASLISLDGLPIQVVEMFDTRVTNYSFTVQNAQTTRQKIIEEVDVSRTAIFPSAAYNGGRIDNDRIPTVELSSSTTLDTFRYGTGASVNGSVFVVEFFDGTVVDRGTISGTGTTDIIAVTSRDSSRRSLSMTAFIDTMTFAAQTTTLDDPSSEDTFRCTIDSDTQFTFDRIDAVGSYTGKWQAITYAESVTPDGGVPFSKILT